MATAVTPTLPTTRCPSFHNWEPVLDSAGKQKLGLRRRRDAPSEIFGVGHAGTKNEKLIGKLQGLFRDAALAQTGLLFLRIPVRIISLLTGDFVAPGLRKAENAWLLRCQQKKSQLPSGYIHVVLRVYYVAREALKHVAKLALYVVVGCPLIGPLWWSAVYGAVLNPFDAGYWFGKIEGWTARDQVPVLEGSMLSGFEQLLSWMGIIKSEDGRERGLRNTKSTWVFITDYLMPCSQPDVSTYTKEFTQIQFGNQFALTLSGKLVVLHEMLTEKREFYRNEGVQVDEALSFLQMCRLHENDLKLEATGFDQQVLVNLTKMKKRLIALEDRYKIRTNPGQAATEFNELAAVELLQESRQLYCFAVELLRKEYRRKTEDDSEFLETKIGALSVYKIPQQLSEEQLWLNLTNWSPAAKRNVKMFLEGNPYRNTDEQIEKLCECLRKHVPQLFRDPKAQPLGLVRDQFVSQFTALYNEIRAQI